MPNYVRNGLVSELKIYSYLNGKNDYLNFCKRLFSLLKRWSLSAVNFKWWRTARRRCRLRFSAAAWSLAEKERECFQIVYFNLKHFYVVIWFKKQFFYFPKRLAFFYVVKSDNFFSYQYELLHIFAAPCTIWASSRQSNNCNSLILLILFWKFTDCLWAERWPRTKWNLQTSFN